MDLYTNEDSQELLQSLDRALPYIEYALKNNKPMFEGERYLTSEEICSILKISRRTLQYYRDDGIFPFIQLPGKVLFRESDIRKVLEDRFRSAYNSFSREVLPYILHISENTLIQDFGVSLCHFRIGMTEHLRYIFQ